MDRFDKLRHEAQVRSNDVCTENSGAVDVNPGAKKTRLALNDYVTESARLIAVRDRAISDRKAATQQCRLCRRALHSTATTIIRIGRLVKLPDTVMETLTIPGEMSDAALLARMQALYDRVLPYQAAFEAEGLPAGALTKLTDGLKALEAARSARAATIQDAASADDALSENQDLASTAILALESVLPTETTAHRELVTKLRVARRIGPRRAQPAAGAPGGTTPAPATATSSTAAPSPATSSTVPPSTTPAAPDPAKDKVS